jgi:transposase
VTTLRTWAAAVRKHGVPEGGSRSDDGARPALLDANGAKLRQRAAKEKNRHVAKRLRALAEIADGAKLSDAAVRADASELAIRKWIHRFRRGGIEALYDGVLGRPKQRHALREPAHSSQDIMLKEIVRFKSGANYGQLRKMVEARFGVRYSPRYLRRLVAHGLKLAQTGEAR